MQDQLVAACQFFHWGPDWIDPSNGKLLSRSLVWIYDYLNLTLRHACENENLRRFFSKKIKAFSASPYQDFLNYAGAPPQFQFKDNEDQHFVKEECIVKPRPKQQLSFGVFSGRKSVMVEPPKPVVDNTQCINALSTKTKIVAEVYNVLSQIHAELKELYPRTDDLVESIKNARAETTKGKNKFI